MGDAELVEKVTCPVALAGVRLVFPMFPATFARCIPLDICRYALAVLASAKRGRGTMLSPADSDPYLITFRARTAYAASGRLESLKQVPFLRLRAGVFTPGQARRCGRSGTADPNLPAKGPDRQPAAAGFHAGRLTR